MTKMDFSVDWKTAIKCVKKVIKNPEDTKNIFALATAVNGPSLITMYHKLLETKEGGELAGKLPEFADLYPLLDKCPEGSVGHAILNNQKYSLESLINISKRGTSNSIDIKHPYMWVARRVRDTHDMYHMLTGYKMDSVLGEGCLAAFTYAQTKSYLWGLIFLSGIWMFKGSPRKIAALFEAYRRGKKCSWLLIENYETMIYEDLEKCRKRLNLPKAKVYETVSNH